MPLKNNYPINIIYDYRDYLLIPNVETSQEYHRDPEDILKKKASFGINICLPAGRQAKEITVIKG